MLIKELIGARIKELRKEISQTQEALAFKADIDKTYWNEVENGKRNVSVMNLNKIINALDISVSDFFNHKSFKKTIGHQVIEKPKTNKINK
jgi:transcriptional regulator with XRE-family HTH domain